MKEETRSQRIRSASAERRARQKAELRRVILDAATTLFEEHGYENFSLRQVAESIGYSATTIYLHFEDKDDLLLHVAFEGFRRFGEVMQAAYDGADGPLDRLRATGRAYLEFGLAHPVHYRLMFMQRGELLDRETPEGYESIIDAFAILTRSLSEGLEAGVIRSPQGVDVESLGALVWSHVHGLVALAISMPKVGRDTARQLIEPHLDILLAGLGRGAGAS
ncbi:MAG: TetR/AcrR family transcriptional regulator [Trueperaceae bacterium]|nr:MAG: TetR/AcrR family transcriptional regulator [Trueperaceae bacterium]